MAVYLDYYASTPMHHSVLDVMVDVYKNQYGNAGSRTHDFGENARQVVEQARGQIASLLGIGEEEVFFTSGSSESNNIAILGLREYAKETGKNHIITTSIEHKSVLETVKSLTKDGFVVDFIDPASNGRIQVEQIQKCICENTLLVSVMHVNNETGIIQPVGEIGELLADTGILFHVDATQSCGKLVTQLKNMKYHMLSLSAHKLYGPQGIGALILRRNKYRLPPVKQIMYGGQQEHGIRPGTIPVALAAGLGKACEIAACDYKKNWRNECQIKAAILDILEQSGFNYCINGDLEYCMPNIINISIAGVESEALMLASKHICGISNGSACTSMNYDLSYVLSAMGLDEQRISEAIRISWGANVEQQIITSGFSEMLNVAKKFIS
ncbi:MAG: aminotransferase class V-fold PLP-dependent enzyme [Eubacterium sp.]|nr:aminotransferase class V-fold PLP-dependent enzyme [Eubacterium sp.]